MCARSDPRATRADDPRLGEAARHREDQRHGKVGGIVCEDARRVRDHDALRARCGEVDMVDPGAEIGDQLQPVARRPDHFGVDRVGHRRHEHVAIGDRGLQLVLCKGMVVRRQCDIEQFGHARLDMRHQLAGDDDARAFRAGRIGHGRR